MSKVTEEGTEHFDPTQASAARLMARCEGRYPVPHKRDEPFEVTYRCGLPEGHVGRHGPSLDSWQTVALGVGERLAADGPDGYYNFMPDQWADWCLAQIDTLRQEQARLEAALSASERFRAVDAGHALVRENELRQQQDAARAALEEVRRYADESFNELSAGAVMALCDAALKGNG